MNKKLKGGIEGIVALIIIVGIVIALIIATILPATREAKALGDQGTTKISNLGDAIGGK